VIIRNHFIRVDTEGVTRPNSVPAILMRGEHRARCQLPVTTGKRTTRMPPDQPADRTGTDVAPPVIDIRNLRKSFGSFLALDDITMTVPRASVGLLGANGAGKTTLIRTLLGLIAPDAGEATVVGCDIRREGTRLREHVGYMPEAEGLPTNTTAADFVSHMAEMSGIPPRAARQRAADVLYHVGLAEERYRLIKGFSTGMRQRVKLAQAIVHDPKLVFLDEPTAGLDPRGREEMLELVERIYGQLGIAVVVSTHILEDVEKVCDHVLILDAGRLVAAQPLEGLDVIGGEVTIRIDSGEAAFRSALEDRGVTVRDALQELGEEFVIEVPDEAVYDVIRDLAVEQGIAIRSMRSQSRSLEDIYLGNVGASREEVGAGV
jgi:ABC-2 type transport system ATP-binding protein